MGGIEVWLLCLSLWHVEDGRCGGDVRRAVLGEVVELGRELQLQAANGMRRQCRRWLCDYHACRVVMQLRGCFTKHPAHGSDKTCHISNLAYHLIFLVIVYFVYFSSCLSKENSPSQWYKCSICFITPPTVPRYPTTPYRRPSAAAPASQTSPAASNWPRAGTSTPARSRAPPP